jgi:hypothetical protein
MVELNGRAPVKITHIIDGFSFKVELDASEF